MEHKLYYFEMEQRGCRMNVVASNLLGMLNIWFGLLRLDVVYLGMFHVFISWFGYFASSNELGSDVRFLFSCRDC